MKKIFYILVIFIFGCSYIFENDSPEITDINTTRGEGGGAGANAEAAIIFGGSSPAGVFDNTESWK